MRVFAICGVIGAPIKEFLVEIRKQEDKFANMCIIDEADYVKGDGKVDFRALMDAIHKEEAKNIIVSGHYLYTNNELARLFHYKIFIDTPADVCLGNYMKAKIPSENGDELKVAERYLGIYTNKIKAINIEIASSKSQADIWVPHDKIDGVIMSVLTDSFIKEDAQLKYKKRSSGFFKNESMPNLKDDISCYQAETIYS
jgi:uridine kinase